MCRIDAAIISGPVTFSSFHQRELRMSVLTLSWVDLLLNSMGFLSEVSNFPLSQSFQRPCRSLSRAREFLDYWQRFHFTRGDGHMTVRFFFRID